MSEVVAEAILEASALRKYVETFTPLVNEGKIHFNDDGLRTDVVEPASVAMISPATLSSEYFEHYDAPGAVTVGVDFDRLLEHVKPADSSDLVELAVDMETRKLEISYGSAELSMALINTDSMRQEPDDPDLGLPNWVTVEASEFDRAVTIASNVSDQLFLRGKPDQRTFEIYAEGDTDDARISLGPEDVIEGKVAEETESAFSIEFLEQMLKPTDSDTELEITFGEEFPVRFEYESLDGHLSAHFMVAPRIMDE